ncbi:MAG: hypothetical protein FWB90_02850 [Fibromonadales bacterium]|nr:hypothetical protein [Fibromonadales bacterium]
MNFEDDAMLELSAAILSIDGPYINISNPENLFEQEMPLEEYENLPDENFPMVIMYIDGEVQELVANDRFEISVNVDVSVIYKIDPAKEKKREGLHRGRKCLRQFVNRILERQRSGKALVPLYLSGDANIEAGDRWLIDHKDEKIFNGVATARFTLRHIELNSEVNNA